MPKGPRGEKRPADVIGAAIMTAKIATGEIEDTVSPTHAMPTTLEHQGRVAPYHPAFS
jgi:hypothetical protein